MKKGKLLVFSFLGATAITSIGLVALTKSVDGINSTVGDDQHVASCYWNHYASQAATATEPGCKEYWICCQHHTPVLEKPTIGQNLNAPAAALPSSVIPYLKENTFDVRYIAPTPTLKTAVFADVQLCYNAASSTTKENLGSTANASLALKNHLSWCKENNVEVLFMNGDIVNNAIREYYQFYQSIFESVYGTDKTTYPEIIWNMGNHEWWDINEHNTATAVSLFNEYANIDSKYLVKRSAVKYALDDSVTIPSYYKVIKGIPFLVISGEDSSGKLGSSLKTEITSWLSEINELPSVRAGGAIYVAYHCPISSTLTHGSGSTTYGSDVETLLNGYPNAILFTGDTHYSGVNERAINQVNFTAINIGSSSYSRMDKKAATMTGDEHFYNMVVSGSKTKDIMSGNANYLYEYTPTIHIMDTLADHSTKINRYFSNEEIAKVQHLGKEWAIPANIKKADFVYTNDRFEKTSSAQSLYGKDGLNWDNEAEVKFDINDGKMTVIFPDVIDYHYCEHFKIGVSADGGTPKYYDVVSNYYKYSRNPEELYFVLSDLPSGSSYQVSVKAYDFFDNPSTNTLTASSVTKGLAIDSIDNALDLSYSDISHRVNISDKAEGSGSSLEYYYKGIHQYNAGAILNRLYYPEGVGGQDYVSIGDGTGLNTIVTMKVKNLDSHAIKIGLTVVDGNGTWKTDFGVEYQKEVAASSDWTLLEWNLAELFGMDSKAKMSHIAPKAKSTHQPTTGYEMHFLIDDIDIKGEGPAPRGEAFTAGQNKDIIIPETSTTSGTITIDVKFTTTGETSIAISLLNRKNWNNYIGYFQIKCDGTKKGGGSYDGVTINALTDGYFRIVIDFAEVTQISGTKPATVDEVYVRNNWTDASGYIDVNPSGPGPAVIRGVSFSSSDHTTDLKGDNIVPITDDFVIDFKFTSGSGTYVRFMLGQRWNKYFGYFKVYADGSLGEAYKGVTSKLLDDGYYRITFDLSTVDKVEDMPKPTEYIDLVYLSKSTATGYMDFNGVA